MCIRDSYITGTELGELNFREIEGLDGIKEAEVEIAGKTIRIAVAHGTGNVEKVLERIRAAKAAGEEIPYHFVEVMACRGGCIAGGKLYCHINAAGDVEPCVFIHYSGANIREKSFLECLQQPLFKEYRKGQPFNSNHLRPCPMLENPEYLPQMVARSGAHSTDLEAPESVEHLCNKCESYAACWRPEAEKLWDEEHPN